MSSDIKFGKIRSFIWPIHRNELGKFIPMFLMFFLIAFNYSLLRSIKDPLIVTAPFSGAEALPFLKVWAILPMALLMTYIFTKLSNKYSQKKVFNLITVIFLTFFGIFTFILYPLREFLHPNAFADKIQTLLPQGFSGMIAVFRNWTLTLFYVMAELWGTTIMTVLFWGLANDRTSIKEAKRFYPLLGVGANVSGIVSGQAAVFLSNNNFIPALSYGNNAWEQSILFVNIIIIISGLAIMGIFRYSNSKTIENKDLTTVSQVKKPKSKISLRQSFAYLAKSKYLICIAVIVLAYNLTTHIIEVVWKNQIKQLYPNPSDFSAYMGNVMTMIGVFATLISLFVSGNFIRKFNWTISALVTPIIVLGTGILFFSFFIFNESKMLGLATLLGSTPLALSVLFGSMQNCLSRACKYTLFDATKEMAYIPLNKESKLKGKAAIDGVGSRLGKSSGSFLTSGLLITFSTLGASAPYIGIIFIVILAVWLISTGSLGKQFNALIAQKEKVTIKETEKSIEQLAQVKEGTDIKDYYPFNTPKKEEVKKP